MINAHIHFTAGNVALHTRLHLTVYGRRTNSDSDHAENQKYLLCDFVFRDSEWSASAERGGL